MKVQFRDKNSVDIRHEKSQIPLVVQNLCNHFLGWPSHFYEKKEKKNRQRVFLMYLTMKFYICYAI